MPSPTLTVHHDIVLNIGEMPILVRTDSSDFARMLSDRYGEFVSEGNSSPLMQLEIRLVPEPGLGGDPDAEVTVSREGGRWIMERGDFRAEWNPESRQGWVRQTLNPYSIDGVLRILHSLILAREGGLLVHAASAVRNGRAFLFAGVSETGKTTISRLAPPDVTLLTDEISYLRGARSQESGVRAEESNSQLETGNWKIENRNWKLESGNSKIETRNSKIEDSELPSPELPSPEPPSPELPSSRVPEFPSPGSRAPELPSPELPSSRVPSSRAPAFLAFGTPFAGELARIGQKMQAPLDTLFLLQQGPENRIEAVSQGQAIRELMRHILFFAHDPELVELVFQTVCDLVRQVPVKRLVFKKDASVWKLIG